MVTLPFSVQRIMPSIIAQNIIGVSPMTPPLASIFALRQKYGLAHSTLWPLMAWECKVHFAHTVFFHAKHPVREKSQDVLLWALQNCSGLYAYTTGVPATPPPQIDPDTGTTLDDVEGWLWSFADPDEAFWFKVRWL